MRAFLCLVGLAAAAPVEDLVARAVPTSAAVCSIVNNLVTKAKAQTQATSFCSSFLHIPTVTTTITQINAPTATTTLTSTTTTNTITAGTATVVVTVSTTFTDEVTETSTITSTTGTTTIDIVQQVNTRYTSLLPIFSNCIGGPPAARRAAPTVAKPACFSVFASSALSSVCSCLRIPTSTVTSRTTVGATGVATTVVSTAASTTTTPVETLSPTLYFTVTETASTTTTLNVQATETNTRTITVSTDVVYAVYRNFALRASVNNLYATVPTGDSVAQFSKSSPASAALFTLDDQCHLVETSGAVVGYVANTDVNRDPYYVYFNPAADVSSSTIYVYLTCTVDPTSLALNCVANGNERTFTVLQGLSGKLVIGSSVYSAGTESSVYLVPS